MEKKRARRLMLVDATKGMVRTGRGQREGWGWKPEPNRRSDLPLIRARQNGIAFLRRFAALAKGRKKIGARGKKSVAGRAQKSSR